jgi:hypothetical protein
MHGVQSPTDDKYPLWPTSDFDIFELGAASEMCERVARQGGLL